MRAGRFVRQVQFVGDVPGDRLAFAVGVAGEAARGSRFSLRGRFRRECLSVCGRLAATARLAAAVVDDVAQFPAAGNVDAGNCIALFLAGIEVTHVAVAGTVRGNSMPRYLLIVLAFAGDSTTIKSKLPFAEAARRRRRLPASLSSSLAQRFSSPRSSWELRIWPSLVSSVVLALLRNSVYGCGILYVGLDGLWRLWVREILATHLY